MDGWPAGIEPRGNGLRIRLWQRGRLVHTETIPGNLGKGHLAVAIRRRAALKARLDAGLRLREEDAGWQTLAEAAQEWLDHLEAKRSTSLGYENLLNRHWLPHYGHWPVNELTAQEIRRYLKTLDVTPKTKKNVVGPLRAVLDHAGIAPNPCLGLRYGRRQKPPIERYRPEERELLLGQVDGQVLAYFALLFGTGLRPGEALGLTWADYDGQELDIHKQIVRRHLEPTTKTWERRRVFVPTWVRPYLNALPSRFARGHLFVNTQGGPHLDTDVFNGAWRRAHEATGIPYRIPYTCRHTRAAELLSAGIDPADAAAQLGHSTEMFLRTYSEFIEEYASNRDRARFDTDRHRPQTAQDDAPRG